ncbi:hypothetical protein HKBW3S25_01409, partial [Candidatus Hakubella thermalkaliphila]
QREKEGTFQTREYITLEAQKLLTKLEEGKK